MATNRPKDSLEREIDKLKRQEKSKAKKKRKAKKSSSSKRQTEYWYNVYVTALRYFGVETTPIKSPTAKSLEKVKNQWKETTKDISDIGVRDVYRYQSSLEKEQADYSDTARDANYRTETSYDMYDIAYDIIQGFIDRVEAIYQDTMTQIDQALREEKGVKREVAIAAMNPDAISRSKSKLIDFINQMLKDVNDNPLPVAEAIQRNGELDYTIAIISVPPSDIEIAFELTLENMKSIWNSVLTQAQELAEQNME